MEVESLERAESMISTNESLILNRLKAVEKSSEEIIKVCALRLRLSLSSFALTPLLHPCLLQEAQNHFVEGETGNPAGFSHFVLMGNRAVPGPEQGADPSCSPLHRALTRLPRCPSFPSIPLSASHPTPRPKHTQKK